MGQWNETLSESQFVWRVSVAQRTEALLGNRWTGTVLMDRWNEHLSEIHLTRRVSGAHWTEALLGNPWTGTALAK